MYSLWQGSKQRTRRRPIQRKESLAIMTMDELMEYILRELPEALFGEDESGEIVISTGLKDTRSGELESIG